MIKVVHVVTNLHIGGLERLVFDLVRHANRQVFEVEVWCLEEMGPIASEIESAGVRVRNLQVEPGSPIRGAVRIATWLRKHKPDIVHTHNMKPFLQVGLASLTTRRHILLNTRHGQHWADTRRAALINSLIGKRCSCVVAVSQDTARVVGKADGIPPDRIRVILNGIDTTRFAAESIGGRPIRVITVARLSPVKDQATLLRAVAQVVSAVPELQLDIVGDGPSRVTLVSLTSELGLEAHVTFHGATDDVPRFLARARLFVLSSISEGVPLTILEAMAAGLPVVSTKVGGVEEVVVDQQTGLLVPPSDAEALAVAMLELLRNPDKSQRMGSAGQRRARQRFDVRGMVRSYESLYSECLLERS